MRHMREVLSIGTRHRALIWVAALLVSAVLSMWLTWRGHLTAAPVLQLTASRALGGRVTVETPVPGLFAQLRDTLNKSPESFTPDEITFIENMVFLTAVEISLVRALDAQGQFRSPLRIGPAEFRLAVMKFDTLEGGRCLTPARIIREKRLVSNDIFLFAGDAEKYARIDPGFSLKAAAAADKFGAAYQPFTNDLRLSARSPLTAPILEGSYSRFEAVLQWAKLQFVIQRPDQEILDDAPRVLKAFGVP